MDNTTHTPIPWKIAEYINNGRAIRRDTHAKNDNDQRLIVHVKSGNYDANARFIVRACNAHYDLIEALGYCIGFLTGEHSTTEADKAEVLEYAYAAIAKVKASEFLNI